MALYQSSSGGNRGTEGSRKTRPFRCTPQPSLPAPNQKQRKTEDILIYNLPGEARADEEHKPQIKNVGYLASYNWIENTTATISVPGKPPRWLPPPHTRQLQEDADVYFRDPNGARYPAFPTEPAVRAILIQDPAFDASEVDIFGCGSTFGALLCYSRNESRTFRFGVERIGRTIFLVRKTNTPRETLEGVRGYGHTFPEVYTTWDSQVRGSASHQRMIRYEFMGLKCIIRSECDGFLPDSNSASHDQVEISTHTTDFLNSNTLSLKISPQTPVASQKLLIRDAGQPIPQTAIFDLKTRSIKSRDHSKLLMEELYPRLWANQTPNLILAFHSRGSFEPANVIVKQVEAEVKDWEVRNAEVLKNFGSLLTKLIDIAKTKDQSRFEVRRTGSGPLEVWSELPEWSALPEELNLRWKGTEENADTNDEQGADGVSSLAC